MAILNKIAPEKEAALLFLMLYNGLKMKNLARKTFCITSFEIDIAAN